MCPTATVDVPRAPNSAKPSSGESLDQQVRETAEPSDIALIALIGAIAAGLSAAVTLRKTHGTTTRYSLPVALAILKLPTGALTAVLGLSLMRGAFVPGLSDLDSSEKILAWAVIFGYAQQLSRASWMNAHRPCSIR